MSFDPSTNSKKQLSWQIPNEQRSKLRAKALQMAFAGLICLGVLLLFGSRSFRVAALVGAVPFALFVIWRAKRHSRHRNSTGDNVRLDDKGLHWRDSQGGERRIAREQIEGFRIGLDPDTIRALPALTLILAGGFESQPVELHTPVGPSHVRQFLVDQMHVGESQRDDGFSTRLHDALIAACESDGDLPEMRILRHGLLIPERQSGGTWLVARLVDGQQVEFLPDSCLYRCRRGDRVIEVDNVAHLGEHIRNEILDARDNDSSDWLSTIDREQVEREQLAVRRDAKRLGFYVELDPQGRLHLEGSRRGIVALCTRIDDAARQLRPTPLGARPDSIRVGGSAVRFEVMLDEVPWHDEITIAGPSSYLHAVAEEIRSRVADEVAADFLVKVKHGECAAQSFGVHLRGDEYDPYSEFAAELDSGQQV